MAAERPATVLGSWVATILRALDTRGLSGEESAARVGIDPARLSDPSCRVPLAKTTSLWRLAVEETGDPFFGLEVARHVRPATFQALSVGVVSSSTFLDALSRMVRFASVVLDPPADARLVVGDNTVEWRNGWEGRREAPSWEAMEAICASIVRTGRFLMGRAFSPVAVRLMRSEAPTGGVFESFFGCPVLYRCDHYALVFDREEVSRPIPTGSDSVAEVADRLSESYLARVRDGGSLADKVRELLASTVASEAPSLRSVAERLAMSPRTLQRRLAEEGVTLRRLVAEVRLEMARELLSVGSLSVEEIARRIGFADAASFYRAFRRVTGSSPSEWRSKTISKAPPTDRPGA
ncbi:MAG: transcriptional regulator [Acidimicrobiales bacterium]|nr:MAG: transcriptional regulator [Acidimicrobiales bacterium]